MDSYRKFNRLDLPYYQDWIRKVAGNKNLWVKEADVPWAMVISRLNGMPDAFPPPWFLSGIAWAHKRTIRVRLDLMESSYLVTVDMRMLMLHEAGHIFQPRKKCVVGGASEYLATMLALRKASKLGLEAELYELRFDAKRWGHPSMPIARRVAYKLLQRKGVL